MNTYKGVPCVHCGKIFDDDDDIVVCPDCGAPHHRSCYIQLQHCALLENHAKGINYESPIKDPEPTPSPATGDAYAQEQYRQSAQQSNSMLLTPVGPVAADEKFDDVTAVELATFIGPNARKYISNFKIMKESHRDFSFNWASFFTNYCFFFYRKMIKPALLLSFIMLLCSIPRFFMSQELMKVYFTTYMNIPIPYNEALLVELENIMQIINAFQFVIIMTVSVFSNKIYYKHVITEIRKVRSMMPEGTAQEQYFSALAQRGQVNPLLGYGSAALTFLLLFGSSFMAAYQMAAQYLV